MTGTVIIIGGRFKKEIQIDSQNYLLLIRDEGGIPEAQVRIFHSGWSDWGSFSKKQQKLQSNHSVSE